MSVSVDLVDIGATVGVDLTLSVALVVIAMLSLLALFVALTSSVVFEALVVLTSYVALVVLSNHQSYSGFVSVVDNWVSYFESYSGSPL